jgi:hypothetical protein
MFKIKITLKNSLVVPLSTVPYCIVVCLAKSSADSIESTILSAVKKAAKLAVYELIIIKVKNHHALVTNLPEIDLSRV